jgi:hypothetical protein
MQKIPTVLLILLFAFVPTCISQKTNEQDIDRLFADLKAMLIKRTIPEALLSPAFIASRRQEEAEKAMRPYVSVAFKYNLADLQRTSQGTAKLPLIIEWETARETGRISDTALLEKVDGRWYFKNFDFMTFPWLLVAVMCSFGVAFSVLVLHFYWRTKKRRQVVPVTSPLH